MLRIYTFANALRLRHGIDYPIPIEEGYEINSIALPVWTYLVDQYTKTKRPNPTPEEMVKLAINKAIKFDFDKYLSEINIGTDKILSWKDSRSKASGLPLETHEVDPILLGFMKDSVVYNKCTIWYTYNGQDVESRELLFESPGQAMWYRSRGFTPSDDLTNAFLEFATRTLNIPTIYRILPEGDKYVKRVSARL